MYCNKEPLVVKSIESSAKKLLVTMFQTDIKTLLVVSNHGHSSVTGGGNVLKVAINNKQQIYKNIKKSI